MANLFGAISDFLSGGAQGKAEGASQAAVDALRDLQTPDIAGMQIELEGLVSQGVLTPEQAQVYLQNPSAFENISTDPALLQAQKEALSSLQEIGKGGMTDMDRAQLAKIQQQEQAQARGAREAIMQRAQERGAGGSGMELLSQLQNQQEAAGRQSMRDTEVAGMAQQRALQALQQAGQLSGQMQSQQFSQQAEKARAQDAISQFNAQTQNQMGQYNTSARNAAQAANLQNAQRIADANVATRNAQQQYNKQLAQQDFENRYRKAGGTAAAYQNQAGMYNQQGQQNTNMAGSLIQAGATAAAAASDKRLKDNIEDFDASAFLDSLTPSKYNYKNPEKHGQGKQVGVMAQDVEKEVPQMVEEGPDGKYLDYNKAGGPIFASMANLHQRLKKIEGKGE